MTNNVAATGAENVGSGAASERATADSNPNYIASDESIYQAGGRILEQADKDLVTMIGTINSGTATSVADVARKNMEINNTVSAVSDCISTSKQSNQKITNALC